MFPGDGGTEERGVKVNLFWKKNSVESKGSGVDTFMFAIKVHQKIYKYASNLLSKCFNNLLLRLQVKPKFQIATFSPDTNRDKGSIGGTFTTTISLVPLAWTKIHTHWKTWKLLLQATDTADSTTARLTSTFTNVTMCHFNILQWSFSYNFKSLIHLWDCASYS